MNLLKNFKEFIGSKVSPLRLYQPDIVALKKNTFGKLDVVNSLWLNDYYGA